MKLTTSIEIVMMALKVQKSRTFLASLGVMIGIASVIVMVAIGKGSQQEVMQVIARMGENLITVSAGEMKRRGGRLLLTGVVTTMNLKDVDAIVRDVPGVAKAAPFQSQQMQVKFGNLSAETQVSGSSPDFLAIRNYRIARGEAFTEEDSRLTRRVAILGETTVKNIFGEEDPIGQTVKIHFIPFTVIGVFEPKGLDTNGTDQDDILLIPVRTMMRRILNQKHITTLYVQAASRDAIDPVIAGIRAVLRERHRLRGEQEDDFTIVSQLEMEALKQETTELFTRLIVGVAAISLVVGGIGILAVMLISVKERTREIGIRRAVGATRGNIVRQFLLESVTIALLGGGVGVASGVGITLALTHWGPWTLVLDWFWVFLAVAICALIGMLFGIAPAVKASRLDPMRALTVE